MLFFFLIISYNLEFVYFLLTRVYIMREVYEENLSFESSFQSVSQSGRAAVDNW